MVKNYKTKQLLDKVKSLSSYKEIPEGHWIIAIRSEEDEFDTFDDKLYLFKGEKFIMVTSCTTNPGGPILVGGWKKHNALGAAVIKSNEWYYDAYKYGLHNGKMLALRQVKKMKYFRDNNNNRMIDESGTIYTDIYNTNIHFNSYDVFDKINNTVKKLIGSWSAGCIVLNNEPDYVNLIHKVKDDPFVSLVLIKEF